MPYSRIILTVFFLLLLQGCGGSGGSQSPAGKPTLEGKIWATGASKIDSDVNDPQAPFSPNDSFEQAQQLSIPVYLGGYVNLAGSGPSGRSHDSGDRDDYFVVNLEGNETLRLALPDTAAENGALLDLKLFDANDTTTPVDSALNISFTAYLEAPSAGTFYVQVHAVSGATIYHLIIGQAGLLATAMIQQPTAPVQFVPGQILLRFKPGISSSAGRNLVSSIASGARQYSPGRYLLRLDETRQVNRALKVLGAAPYQGLTKSASPQQSLKDATLYLLKQLRCRPDIAWAEPNYVRKALLVPNDPFYRLQWHYKLLNLPKAWDQTTGSSDVIVAVIDSGIVASHPDLSSKLVAGYDFISNASNAGDGDGIDDNPEDPGQGSPPFHGTHVAGTIGAAFGNSTGGTGVAGRARIMPVRVLGQNGATDADLVQAILFAAGLNPQTGSSGETIPQQAADIINISLGGPSASAALQDAVDQARAQGVIIVSASGNDGTAALSYPAALDGVVSVAGVDISAAQAWYSNYGPSVDLAAPGGDISTDLNRDGYVDGVLSTLASKSGTSLETCYGYYEGTSMAAAHVSGVAALMKSVRPALTPAEFDAYLSAGSLTFDAGMSGRDDIYGHGILDAARAVEAAGSAPPAVLLAKPAVVRLGYDQPSVTLFIQKVGTGDAGIENVQSDQAWLQATPLSVDNAGIGSYSISVDRSGLSGGVHVGRIILNNKGTINPFEVKVVVEVLPDLDADVGHLYLLLRNSTNAETIDRLEINAQNGTYDFTFSKLEPGNYTLLAGTDLDNDGIINEQGEAVGSYISFSNQQPVVLSDNATGIDFLVGFDQNPFGNIASANGK